MRRDGFRTRGGFAAHAVVALALASVPRGVAAQDTGTADPLVATAPAAEDREDSLRCLTLAIAYEAGNQPQAGQEAVAEVVLNRTRHPAFPKSVCGVVFQGSERSTGCQFTFTCDGALDRRLSDRTVTSARRVAEAVLDGAVPRRVAGALNYHADYVKPSWAPTLDLVARIGAHLFYRPQSGGVPVSGRGGDRNGPRHDLIARVYARYLGGAATPAAADRAAPHAAPVRVASNATFAPWGLGLR